MVADCLTRCLPRIERDLEARKDLRIARLQHSVEGLIRRGRIELVKRRVEHLVGQRPGLLDTCGSRGLAKKRLPQGVSTARHIHKRVKEIDTDELYRVHGVPLLRQ